MRPIQVKQLDYDLTPTAGLALIGQSPTAHREAETAKAHRG